MKKPYDTWNENQALRPRQNASNQQSFTLVIINKNMGRILKGLYKTDQLFKNWTSMTNRLQTDKNAPLYKLNISSFDIRF